MTAIAGLRGSGDWGVDERPKDFREMILKLNPNGESPLMALLAKAKKEKVTDQEFFWWNEPYTIWRGRVKGAHAATKAEIVIDSSDPDNSDLSVPYGLGRHLVPGDLLLVEIADAASYENEILEVRSVQSDTSFIVTRGASGTSAANIPDNTHMMRIGNTHAEGAAAPQSATRNPIRADNYIQKFQKAYEVTYTSELTKTRTNNHYQTDKMRKSFDHSTDMELAFLFGKKSMVTGSNGKPKYTTAGLRSLLPAGHSKVYSAAVTYNTLLDDLYKVFDWKTPGGDSRIILCGNQFLNELNKITKKEGTVYWDDKIEFYGMKLKRFCVPQGDFMVKTHPLMNRMPTFTKSGFVIDAAALKYRYLRDTFSKDNIQGNDELDTKKGAWYTQAGLELQYGGLTCMYLGNLSVS